MAKRKRAQAKSGQIDVVTRLPLPVLKFYQDVAALCGLSAGDCISVALASDLVRRRVTVGKTPTP